MKIPALIDSSIWIGFLRGGHDFRILLEDHLQAGTAAFCPVTWFELYAGCRGEKEMTVLNQLKSLCLWMEIDAAVWTEATGWVKKPGKAA